MDKKIRLIGAVIFGIVGFFLGYIWFGWKFDLVLFILFWGNNLMTIE